MWVGISCLKNCSHSAAVNVTTVINSNVGNTYIKLFITLHLYVSSLQISRLKPNNGVALIGLYILFSSAMYYNYIKDSSHLIQTCLEWLNACAIVIVCVVIGLLCMEASRQMFACFRCILPVPVSYCTGAKGTSPNLKLTLC